MEELTKQILEKVFSQEGLAGALLLFATVYMTRQFSMERKEHGETREKLSVLAEKSILSSVQTTEALAAMRVTIELLAGGRLRK